MMALIERCPSTWHMLIERQYYISVVVVYRWVNDNLATLKYGQIPSKKEIKDSALRC